MNNNKEIKATGNLDPVCGITVTKEEAVCYRDYKGKTYCFCAASCKDEFEVDPDKYLRVQSFRKKGGGAKAPPLY